MASPISDRDSPIPSECEASYHSRNFRIVGVVKFAETVRKFPFILPSNAHVPKTAYIPPNLAGWRHLMALELYFQGSHEKSVAGSGKLGTPNNPELN